MYVLNGFLSDHMNGNDGPNPDPTRLAVGWNPVKTYVSLAVKNASEIAYKCKSFLLIVRT